MSKDYYSGSSPNPVAMRPSRVLKKLRNGELALGVKMNLESSRAVEIVSMCGYDCVWLCMEHVPSDWSLLEKQILAAKCYDVDAMIRIARGSYSDYIRPLEMDAAGLMVPHIMSLEDAKKTVRMTRFHPVGLRPVDGGNADGHYCEVPMLEYMSQANRERFVFIQIEDPEPLDELDEIASLEGIDLLFFGPADFSQGIGAPAQWDDPRIEQARIKIAQTALRHGKFAGTTCAAGDASRLVDMGYRFLTIGADVIALSSYFKDIISSVESLRAKL